MANKYDSMSWMEFTRTRPFRALVLAAFSVICIFRVDLRTLIPLPLLWMILALLGGTGFLICKHKFQRTRGESLYIGFCVVPAIFHFLLMLNLLNAFHARDESFRYECGRETMPSKGRGTNTFSSTMIQLDHNAYEAYSGIRVFMDHDQIGGGDTITYTFATGLLGITVMKDWQFH